MRSTFVLGDVIQIHGAELHFLRNYNCNGRGFRVFAFRGSCVPCRRGEPDPLFPVIPYASEPGEAPTDEEVQMWFNEEIGWWEDVAIFKTASRDLPAPISERSSQNRRDYEVDYARLLRVVDKKTHLWSASSLTPDNLKKG